MITPHVLKVGDVVHLAWQNLSRRGVVAEVYHDTPNHVGFSNIMYAVRWDDTGLTERGYMKGLVHCSDVRY